MQQIYDEELQVNVTETGEVFVDVGEWFEGTSCRDESGVHHDD
ncbi:hypothetical protein [Streptomyces flavofungini]